MEANLIEEMPQFEGLPSQGILVCVKFIKTAQHKGLCLLPPLNPLSLALTRLHQTYLVWMLVMLETYGNLP